MRHVTCMLVVLFGVLLSGCASQEQVNLGALQLEKRDYGAMRPDPGLSFAVANPTIIIESNVSPQLYAIYGERLKYDAARVACHIGERMSSVLLSKGFTVTDMFRSTNEMTYTQKRNSTAVFTALIRIRIDEDGQTEYVDQVPKSSKGQIVGSISAKIVTIEPLTQEKVWIKDVPIDDVSFPIEMNYTNVQAGSKTSVPPGTGAGAAALDNLFVRLDQSVLSSADKFIDADEFRSLNRDIVRIKEIKRY